jgi:hypothetical protein
MVDTGIQPCGAAGTAGATVIAWGGVAPRTSPAQPTPRTAKRRLFAAILMMASMVLFHSRFT